MLMNKSLIINLQADMRNFSGTAAIFTGIADSFNGTIASKILYSSPASVSNF